MRVKISKELKQLYDTSKKEPEYSLQFIADSMDPDCCAAAAVLVQKFSISDDVCEIAISDHLVEVLKQELNLGAISNMLLEALLWVAILFPEV